MRTHPHEAAVVYGVDIGKTVFHVVAVDGQGQPVQRAKFSRATLLIFFANARAARIGMEACPGSQWLARKLQSLGHEVRIMPAQFVRPFVKSNKNDALDAEAIAEAVMRPTMRFVAIKRCDQIDTQALHRVRDRLMHSRTRLICQMRSFCLEYGLPIRTGAGVFKLDLPRILGDEASELTPAMRTLLAELWEEFKALEARLAQVSDQIEALASTDETARRLATIPGIGPLGATALIAAVGDGKQFRKARDLAAWLGLVPKQYSTGGKTTLLGISKRGNPYVRRLLIHGARSCVRHLDRRRDRLGVWLDQLEARMHVNKVVVALANKIARVAWSILVTPGLTYRRVDPRYAD
jgi:transposase